MATATRTSARAELPGALRELVGSFRKRRLLVWASALSFQLITAVVPFLLFATLFSYFALARRKWQQGGSDD